MKKGRTRESPTLGVYCFASDEVSSVNFAAATTTYRKDQ
jgi:hypothetical protein